jgi:hypothetical protein
MRSQVPKICLILLGAVHNPERIESHRQSPASEIGDHHERRIVELPRNLVAEHAAIQRVVELFGQEFVVVIVGPLDPERPPGVVQLFLGGKRWRRENERVGELHVE